jgi:hypothetical protein
VDAIRHEQKKAEQSTNRTERGFIMKNMEINEKRAEQFDKLEKTAIELLQDYLDGNRQGGDDVVTARCVLNVIKGNRQTMTAREALKFNMASSITDDPKVLKRYVEATNPAISKLLGAKKAV